MRDIKEASSTVFFLLSIPLFFQSRESLFDILMLPSNSAFIQDSFFHCIGIPWKILLHFEDATTIETWWPNMCAMQPWVSTTGPARCTTTYLKGQKEHIRAQPSTLCALKSESVNHKVYELQIKRDHIIQTVEKDRESPSIWVNWSGQPYTTSLKRRSNQNWQRNCDFKQKIALL